MQIDDGIAKLVIGSLWGAVATLVGATWYVSRLSKRIDEGLDNVDRLTRLIDGDPKEQEKDHLRLGINGRIKVAEGGLVGVTRIVKAILRGLRVPSNSDEHQIEVAVRDATRSEAEAALARSAVIEEQEQRFSYPELQTDRFGTPQVHGRPATIPRAIPAVPREEPGTTSPRVDNTGRHRAYVPPKPPKR